RPEPQHGEAGCRGRRTQTRLADHPAQRAVPLPYHAAHRATIRGEGRGLTEAATHATANLWETGKSIAISRAFLQCLLLTLHKDHHSSFPVSKRTASAPR